MSKNRNRNRRQSAATAQQPAPAQHPAPTPVQEARQHSDSTPGSSAKWSLVVSVSSILISGTISFYSLSVSRESLAVSKKAHETNQRSQDRASGKIRANFEYVDFHNDPEKMRPFIKKQVGTDNDIFRLDSLDDLLRWHPAIKIRNTGGEIIDSVRVDVWYQDGRAYGPGVRQIIPKPIKVVKISSREVSSFGKILPQQTATVFFLPLLLSQMLQARSEAFPENDQEGSFRVQVACRLVGATTHDNAGGLKLNLHWRPAGFADEKKCMHVLKMQNVLVTVE